jgi:hypothetical protein
MVLGGDIDSENLVVVDQWDAGIVELGTVELCH